MTASKSKNPLEELEEVRRMLSSKRDERLRVSAELDGLRKQRAELEAKVREELGVEPDQLQAEVERLQAESAEKKLQAEEALARCEQASAQRAAVRA